MKNPVNRLATAAPRALDSLLGGKTNSQEEANNKNRNRDRTCSFDLDLSGLNLDNNRSAITAAGGCCSSVGDAGGSIAEEGGGSSSVVTFEELSELSRELSLDWNGTASTTASGGSSGIDAASGTPSPN